MVKNCCCVNPDTRQPPEISGARDLRPQPCYGTAPWTPERPGPRLASDPQRVGQAVTHLLILYRNESVNINVGEEVSMGHIPAFWARTESEQPSRFIRGIKADKAAGGFVNQPMTWLTNNCKEMVAHVYLLDVKKSQLAKNHLNARGTLL